MSARRRPARHDRRCRGFTLIEMLVGLTLFALLSVLLFGGFRFGLRAWESGGARAEQADEIRLVQEMLHRQLAAAQPPATAAAEGAPAAGPSFAGTARSLAFVATLPGRSAAGGLYRFELAEAAGDDEGTRLALAWSALGELPPDPAAAAAQTETLLGDIAAVSFAYYGSINPEAPAQWRDRWDESLGLPALIRLSVAFPPGDARAWPDLFIAPRLRAAGQ